MGDAFATPIASALLKEEFRIGSSGGDRVARSSTGRLCMYSGRESGCRTFTTRFTCCRPTIAFGERRTFVGREFGGILALGGSSLRRERETPPRSPCHAAERQVRGGQEDAGRLVHASRAGKGQSHPPPSGQGRGQPVSGGATRTTLGNIRPATVGPSFCRKISGRETVTARGSSIFSWQASRGRRWSPR